jgi:hypothetical protein
VKTTQQQTLIFDPSKKLMFSALKNTAQSETFSALKTSIFSQGKL